MYSTYVYNVIIKSKNHILHILMNITEKYVLINKFIVNIKCIYNVT